MLRFGFLFLFVSIISQAALAGNRYVHECEHYLKFVKQEHQVWGTVTSRSLKTVSEELEVANRHDRLKGVRGIILPFDLGAVFAGRRSILSLGEGNSDFIYSLLKAAKDQGRTLQAHATDMIYTSPEKFDIHRIGQLTEVKKFTSEFPANYHGAYFQDMQIKDQNGQTLQFDEIISSNSLTYIIGRRNGRESEEEIMARDLVLMRNVLAHLKPGGNLRIWPVVRPGEHGGGIVRTSCENHLERLLTRLMNEGDIRNHNYIFRDIQSYHITLQIMK